MQENRSSITASIKKFYLILFALFILAVSGRYVIEVFEKSTPHSKYKIGDVVDSLDGVYVYYNGKISHQEGRNVSKDGYNIGLKYQCVEFVKRYYYEHYHHKMPNSYGDAKDFFDSKVQDGALNQDRNLIQFCNPSSHKPQKGDLIILDGHIGNKHGHVAIISSTDDKKIYIVQQNPGVYGSSRDEMLYAFAENKYTIANNRVLGWLRRK